MSKSGLKCSVREYSRGIILLSEWGLLCENQTRLINIFIKQMEAQRLHLISSHGKDSVILLLREDMLGFGNISFLSTDVNLPFQDTELHNTNCVIACLRVLE